MAVPVAVAEVVKQDEPADLAAAAAMAVAVPQDTEQQHRPVEDLVFVEAVVVHAVEVIKALAVEVVLEQLVLLILEELVEQVV